MLVVFIFGMELLCILTLSGEPIILCLIQSKNYAPFNSLSQNQNFWPIPQPRAIIFSQFLHDQAPIFSKTANFLLFFMHKTLNFRLRRALMFYF